MGLRDRSARFQWLGGVVARLIGLSERIESVRFSPDGTRVLAGGGPEALQNTTARVWPLLRTQRPSAERGVTCSQTEATAGTSARARALAGPGPASGWCR